MGEHGSDRGQGEGQLLPEGDAQVVEAARALAAGRLVLLPTETVYGLGADAANPAAVASIFEAKGRPRFNPLIAHVADIETAVRIAVLDDRALALAKAFWPGPLTLVAPIRDASAVCDLARAGLDTVARRFEYTAATCATSSRRMGSRSSRARSCLSVGSSRPCVVSDIGLRGRDACGAV